jgi:hypothetical protein
MLYLTIVYLTYFMLNNVMETQSKKETKWSIFYVNLVITWSRNPHAKTPIPGKPSKSGLIGVWHKDNLYLGTSTIGNGDPHPTNID